VTANGSDSDAPAGSPAGSVNPEAGSAAAWDPAGSGAGYASQAENPGPAEPAGQAEPAPGPLLGGLISGLQVPGMAVQSPALDYMLGKQRRRMRNMAAVAASILAIVVIAAVVTVATHHGSKQTGGVHLTAAQVLQQAARQQSGLDSESATFSEHVSGQLSATISGTVELRRKPLLMAMNLNVAAGSSHEAVRGILSDKAMYLKISGAADVPNSLADKWLKIPLTGLSPSSPFGGLEQELQNENPAAQFAGLEAAAHLQAVGSQVIGGVPATRYNGSFAPSAAVKTLPAAQRATLGPIMHVLKGDVRFSVWIDSSHHVRQMQETESTGAVTIAIQCTYNSFNQPVKIVVPPSRQVYSPPASVLNE
jgi:hypothetical protein